MIYDFRFPCNPSMKGQYRVTPDIVYACHDGEAQLLSLIMPWDWELPEEERQKPLPLIVFVQGSAWTKPDLGYELPQLVEIAKKGYVIATVSHRSRLEGQPGRPATECVKDVKSAIRFLRANRKKYNIDPDHVVIWGTSSGGNLAQLVGLTIDDPAFRCADYPEESDAVNAVVSCFGPSDLIRLLQQFVNMAGQTEAEAAQTAEAPENPAEFMRTMAGSPDPAALERILAAMSPIHHIEDGKKYPPFLLLHGDSDEVVSCAQLTYMAERLSQAGADVTTAIVEGAPHEGPFWSQPVYDLIESFIREHI